MKLNVVVGRFQPLHNGHVSLINQAFDSEAKTLILIGCSTSDGSSTKNPFTYEERKSIIVNEYSSQILDGTLCIEPLFDNSSDIIWLENIKNILYKYNKPDMTFIVFDKDNDTVKTNKLLSTKFNLKKVKSDIDISATSVRDLLSLKVFSKDIPTSTKNFLLNKYKDDYTVDEVTCRACGEGILLPNIEHRKFIEKTLNVTLSAISPYLTCSVCGASVINKSCQELFKINKQKAISDFKKRHNTINSLNLHTTVQEGDGKF